MTYFLQKWLVDEEPIFVMYSKVPILPFHILLFFFLLRGNMFFQLVCLCTSSLSGVSQFDVTVFKVDSEMPSFSATFLLGTLKHLPSCL
jgi:hypothetical protein